MIISIGFSIDQYMWHKYATKKIYKWVKIASVIRVYLHLPPPFYISPNEKNL